MSPVFYQVYSSTQMCLYQTPGRRPPPTTGRCLNTVTRGWVGAPNGRAPFRFHSAVVGFVDRCLSKTRNLAGSNKHWAKFSQADLGPRSAQEYFFSGFLKSLIFFFRRFAFIASGARSLLADIFEILTFNGNIAFPLSPVVVNACFFQGLTLKNGVDIGI